MIPDTQRNVDALSHACIEIAHELSCAPGDTPAFPGGNFEPNFVGGWDTTLRFSSLDGGEIFDVVVGGGFDDDDGATFLRVHVEGTDAGTTWLLDQESGWIVDENVWTPEEPLPEWITLAVRDIIALVASNRRRTRLS